MEWVLRQLWHICGAARHCNKPTCSCAGDIKLNFLTSCPHTTCIQSWQTTKAWCIKQQIPACWPRVENPVPYGSTPSLLCPRAGAPQGPSAGPWPLVITAGVCVHERTDRSVRLCGCGNMQSREREWDLFIYWVLCIENWMLLKFK